MCVWLALYTRIHTWCGLYEAALDRVTIILDIGWPKYTLTGVGVGE